MKLSAIYYDGRSARAHAVHLLPLRDQVWLSGEGFERREALAQVRIGERLGGAPRMIHFRDGSHCEIGDHAGFAQYLDAIGYRERAIDLAQRSWLVAGLAVLLVIAAGFAGYRWGLPLLADQLARRVPEAVTADLSQRTLDFLDEYVLQPSALDEARRERLHARFDELDAQGRAQLLFRAAPRIGANALALPDGRIVLLDELVRLSDDDEEILGVLAHELAHVERHHGLRLLIQSTLVGAFAAWWLGDFSPLITAAPIALLQARHSRELEAEADAEAARKLRAVGIEPSKLADALEKLAAAHGDKTDREDDWRDYLSSHPANRERIRALRGER